MNSYPLKGIAALIDLLNCIGTGTAGAADQCDHEVAKILVENEMELRSLIPALLYHFHKIALEYTITRSA